MTAPVKDDRTELRKLFDIYEGEQRRTAILSSKAAEARADAKDAEHDLASARATLRAAAEELHKAMHGQDSELLK